MNNKNTLFYSGETAISVDFSGEEIISYGSVVLLEKRKRKNNLLNYYNKYLPDPRNLLMTTHPVEKLLKQQVFALIQGYQDANDVKYLRNDPVFKDVLQGDMAYQPNMSRFENRMDKSSIFNLCCAWVDKYVESLKNRRRVVIDIDFTHDQTYGKQQMTMFNGFYGHYMYSELYFHDGDSGQMIVPVLRPGNSHSNKWMYPF